MRRKADDAVVHDAVLGGEALEGFELHVLHLGEHLGVVVGDGALALESEAAGGCFPYDVVGVQVESGLDLVGGLRVEVGFDGGEIGGDDVGVGGYGGHGGDSSQ